MPKQSGPYSPMFADLGFNPANMYASFMDSIQDTTNYNQSDDFSTMNNIGGTAGGGIANQLGNTAISTGNPVGVVGGLAAKGVGGAMDTVAYLRRDVPDIVSQRKGIGGAYDLGDEANSISNMASGGEAFGEALKKTGVLGVLPGVGAGILASRKAKKNKKEAMSKLSAAQGDFNSDRSELDKRNSVFEQYMAQRKMLNG